MLHRCSALWAVDNHCSLPEHDLLFSLLPSPDKDSSKTIIIWMIYELSLNRQAGLVGWAECLGLTTEQLRLDDRHTFTHYTLLGQVIVRAQMDAIVQETVKKKDMSACEPKRDSLNLAFEALSKEKVLSNSDVGFRDTLNSKQ